MSRNGRGKSRRVSTMEHTNSDPIVVIGAARTPIGHFMGGLAGLTAPDLGGVAIRGALERAALDPARVDEVAMGCVLSAGLGQAPARQASFAAGLPRECGAMTINKMCGSGMRCVTAMHDALVAGSITFAVAGGTESMSRAPYLLDRARSGYRMGHGQILDHMMRDGLEDAYQPGRAMGVFADEAARRFSIGREAQDTYTLECLHRCQTAAREGWSGREIIPVEVPGRQGAATTLASDEELERADPDRFSDLKPVFTEEGTVTVANASSISDGAAALVLTRRSEAEREGHDVAAVIRAHATHAGAPADFPSAPVSAITAVAEKAGWSVQDIDLFEINEAFAVVPLIAMNALGLRRDRVNVMGGACMLGHPIGASGARILVTLLTAMAVHQVRRGVAAICIGGGEALALAVERP